MRLAEEGVLDFRVLSAACATLTVGNTTSDTSSWKPLSSKSNRSPPISSRHSPKSNEFLGLEVRDMGGDIGGDDGSMVLQALHWRALKPYAGQQSSSPSEGTQCAMSSPGRDGNNILWKDTVCC